MDAPRKCKVLEDIERWEYRRHQDRQVLLYNILGGVLCSAIWLLAVGLTVAAACLVAALAGWMRE